MLLLDPLDYHHTRALFDSLDHQLIIPAVFASSSPGQIYANHCATPTVALMVSPEGNFMVGDRQDEVARATLKPLIDNLIGNGNATEIQYDDPAWVEYLASQYQITYPLVFEASYYVQVALQSQAYPILPPGLAFQPVNRELLNQTGLDNLKIVLDKIDANWSSREEFFGIAYGHMTR